MKDDPKIIQLLGFKKSNNIGDKKFMPITTEEMYRVEINDLQKNLYSAYDRITQLKNEIYELKSTKINKE
jgi:hypothetical protein